MTRTDQHGARGAGPAGIPPAGFLALSALVIAADQASKAAIAALMPFGAVRPVAAFFNLVHARNTGAAFSLLAQAGGWQRWLFAGIAIVAVALFGWLLLRSTRTLFSTGVALMLGGAVGNLIDRIACGYVTDFLDFYVGTLHWPAFNVADIGVCLGAALIVLDELIASRRTGNQDP